MLSRTSALHTNCRLRQAATVQGCHPPHAIWIRTRATYVAARNDKGPEMARAEILQTNDFNVRRAVISAFCTSLIGIGLARFAYTPLLPAVIDAHWFAPSDAAYLGAANLAGYLAGALLGRPLSVRLSVAELLRAMMILATA